MMVELAIATSIPIAEWLDAGDTAIATALVVLEETAERIRRGR